MKKILLLLPIILLLSCKKENCTYCKVFVKNNTIYPVWVVRDGGNRPDVPPGETRQQDIHGSGLIHSIKCGFTDSLEVPHVFFDEKITCDSECSDFNIVVKE